MLRVKRQTENTISSARPSSSIPEGTESDRDCDICMRPTGPDPSVWSLKQFLEVNDPMDHPPPPSIKVDYGFINCRTFEKIYILMEIYGKVRKTANPLELHEACVAGELFQFASGYVRMEERWRSLMSNFCPLEEKVESELPAVALI